MAVKSNLRWQPPLSWFYFRCQFWSYDHFPLVAVDIPTNFHKCTSTDCWSSYCVLWKIQDGGRPPSWINLRYFWTTLVHEVFLPTESRFFKFRIDRKCSFEDIAIRIFSKFGLKCLVAAPKFRFFLEFRPLRKEKKRKEKRRRKRKERKGKFVTESHKLVRLYFT